jgi:hypothetical protein
MLPFESTATECHHAAAIAIIVLSVKAPPSSVAVLIDVPEAAPVPHCPFLFFNLKIINLRIVSKTVNYTAMRERK